MASLQYGQVKEVPPDGGWTAAPHCGQLEGKPALVITGKTPAAARL